ncbi:Lipid-A-disaccharide synthase [Limihaloglobus sulfuriphilus]|uniref:Lipid-A-disaccharide synthase n=1 Tax=Limihaloglobus sulfuriphilus TaxID=1851148 RepID=A0A1Q2MB86_9BACT|nr:lipid-A-disaccharide synthase [Limihaloglobus sulfuriphilus]AQQ69941.1 Lipid-A-disaccharide synthase [Limihaloglobus sulfuriphilus]
MSNRHDTIFLSAGEASGDAHCANLIRSLRAREPHLRFVGIGGDRMAEAGCELLANTVKNAAMIYNAFKQIGYYRRLLKDVKEYFRGSEISKIVVCDSPAFNFHVAKLAKRFDIPTFFYVAPQLWAWAPWRIHKLRRCCDTLACILPFEQQWFRSRGINCRFVGNPLFDDMDLNVDSMRRDYGNFSADKARIVLLPGSRDAEIEHLWQPMQTIAKHLRGSFPDISVHAVACDTEKLDKLKASRIDGLECEFSTGDLFKQCRNADLAFVASGSATLQVAASGCPMVVMYQSNRILWHIVGRWLIRIKHLSLVNILAGRKLVPEFMPYFTSVDPIISAAENLLKKPEDMKQINHELLEIVRPMAAVNTSDTVADMIVSDLL